MKRAPWLVPCPVILLMFLGIPADVRGDEVPLPGQAATAPVTEVPVRGEESLAEARTAERPSDFLFPEGTDVEPTWRVGAYLMNQTGVFVSDEKTRDDVRYATVKDK